MAAKVVAIAHSDEDELVEMEQPQLMLDVSKAVPKDEVVDLGENGQREARETVYIEMKGKHDETRQKAAMDRASFGTFTDVDFRFIKINIKSPVV